MKQATLDELTKKLCGYSYSPKGKYTFLIDSYLTDEEFVLWQFSIEVLVDWDKRHSNFGTFLKNYSLIADYLNWSTCKTSRLAKQLIAKNLWKIDHDRIVVYGMDIIDREMINAVVKAKKIVDPFEEILNLPSKYVKNSKDLANLKDEKAKAKQLFRQEKLAKMQKAQPKDYNNHIGSEYNNPIPVPDSIFNNDEERDKFLKEVDSKLHEN